MSSFYAPCVHLKIKERECSTEDITLSFLQSSSSLAHIFLVIPYLGLDSLARWITHNSYCSASNFQSGLRFPERNTAQLLSCSILLNKFPSGFTFILITVPLQPNWTKKQQWTLIISYNSCQEVLQCF